MNLLSVAAFLGSLQLCLGADILMLIPTPAKSHFLLGERLIRELIKKGHHVTFVSSFSMSNPPPNNLTEVVVPELLQSFDEMVQLGDDNKEGRFGMRHMTPWSFLSFSAMGEIIHRRVMESKVTQHLLKSNKKFDLVMGECFLIEGLLGGFSHKYGAPIIGIATFMPNTWSNSMVGNPAPAAYVPEPILPFTNQMNFLQRYTNLLYGFIADLIHHYRQLPKQDRLMRKYFGNDLPPLKSIISKTSLVLVNNHHSLNFPRAYLPNMVEVGSYHIEPPKALPKDLKKLMDEARDGVILFSMGSNLPSSDLPKEKLQSILKAFSKLKELVLWKFEIEDKLNLPKNVKISKWLPQSDILAHSNVKLFITHGGLLSYTEAVLRGVPLVTIPIFGDQQSNANFIEQLNVGVQLQYDDINEDTFLAAIKEVLSNPTYTKNMKHRSRLMQDVPMPQIDQAIYWIEYVVRHKGASHLRSKAQDLSWYQLYLIDVFCLFGLIAFIVLYIISKALKCIYYILFKKSSKVTKSKKIN